MLNLSVAGTLMAPPVLYRVIYGTTKPAPWQKVLTTVRPALLTNYRRHKVKHADYPAILPHGSTESGPSLVRGSFVTGLTDGDLWRLDIFEGSQYTRRKVRVKILQDTALDETVTEDKLTAQIEDAVEVEAETYVWSDPREDLEEEEWDFDEFKREKMWAWVGVEKGVTDTENGVQVDSGFADVDRAVKEAEEDTKKDPTGGRGAGGKITRELEAAAA